MGGGCISKTRIKRYASTVERIDGHLRPPLTLPLFLDNLRFALKESWKITFLPQETLHE